MDIETEKILRFMLKKLSPEDYTKHHADALLEQLYSRPKEDRSE